MKLGRIALCFLAPIAALSATRVTLPIEVVGADGAIGSATFELTDAVHARSLAMEIHGIAYPGMISVQINGGAWIPLSNDTVQVAEPAKSYGGIGGAFGTMKMILPLPQSAFVAGSNTLRFRFDQSDGLASGFRVLAFNLMAEDGTPILSPTNFEQEDPARWVPPLRDPKDIAAGKSLWYSATLVVNNRPGAPAIHAHCADCHAQDGRDLKYFNFSNASIIARSQFHGLSVVQGEQIASYIRSLDAPGPGRPWNPPYQPGPQLDSQPVANWSAGAGLSWVLDNDEAALPYLFPSSGGALSISAESFRPDGDLNARQIPISLQLPDWNHWLPRVHPLDAWGGDFSQSELAHLYNEKGGLRGLLSEQRSRVVANGEVSALFDKWTKSQKKFLTRFTPRDPSVWSQDLGNKVYSTQLWQLVKAWELAQEFHLEDARSWANTIPLATAPAEEGIPDGPAGMGATALTNEYFNNSWYELQVLLNSGQHRHHGRQPIDWLYVIARFRNLQQESHRSEPARLLISIIKALQFSDPKAGPDNQLRGWRPEGTVDPRIMINADWAPLFQTLPSDTRRLITEAMLEAWLDKNLKYRTAQYFAQGKTARESYSAPKEFAEISGGNTWLAAPQFRAVGVSKATVDRLIQWGNAYSNMAARLQY